jgi:hypothetical protein
LDPAKVIRSIPCFDGPIRAMEFSRDHSLLAVSSPSQAEIRVFLVDGGRHLFSFQLARGEKVSQLRFDEFTLHLAAQIQPPSLKLFQIPDIDAALKNDGKSVKAEKPLTSFALPNKGTFWAFFGLKLFQINVVTADGFLSRMQYDPVAKVLRPKDSRNLRDVV